MTTHPDESTEAAEWWDEVAPLPGVGVGYAEAVRRRRAERDRQQQRAARQRLREQRRALSWRQRRHEDRAARRTRRILNRASREHDRTVREAFDRFDRADEPPRLWDRLVDALGPSIPLWAEQRPHITTSRNAAAIYPFHDEAGLGHRGVLVGLNITGGGAFSWDPWHLYSRTSHTATPSGPRQIANGNMIVIGAPGGGKSALVKTISFRLAVFGRRVEFVDPRGEYTPVVRALDGVVVRLEPGGDQALNPLTDIGDPVARRNLLLSLARAMLGRRLAASEQMGLLGALKQADTNAAPGEEICLPHVERALRDPGPEILAALGCDRAFALDALRDVMLQLALLREGPLAGMFDQATTVPVDAWDRQALSIDLSAVAQLAGADDDGQNLPLAITMLCCSAFLSATAVQRARRCAQTGAPMPRTVRVNDEGWRVLAVPGQAAAQQAEFKLQRSTGVVNVMVMHRFSDLRAVGDHTGSRARELAAGLFSDADTVVIYRQDAAELADIAEKASLTDAEADTVEHLQEGQALWLVGPSRILVHHLRSSYEVQLSDTDHAMTPELPIRRPANGGPIGV